MTNTPLSDRLADFSTYRTDPETAIALMAQARSQCPVAHSDELGGFHILMRYTDVRAALLDWRRLANGPSSLRPYTEGQPVLPPSSYDPPVHTHWRNTFSNGVNPKTTERIEPLVRADVAKALDAIDAERTADLVAAIAEPIPMLAISHILGLDPQLHETLRSHTNSILGSVDDLAAFEAAFAKFSAFGYAEVEKRRDVPRDDYLSVLATTCWDDRRMTPDEIGQAVMGLVIGGHHTTVASITSMLFEVIRNPSIKARLIADRALIPVAVEESLRMHHPLFGLYRTAATEVEIENACIRKGESIYLNWHSANRDPDIFENPDVFSLDRGSNPHLTFGLGKHSCVGASTARMEMRIVLDEFLSRFPDATLADAAATKFCFSGAESLLIPELRVHLK